MQGTNSALDNIQAKFGHPQLEKLPTEVIKQERIDEQCRAISNFREVDGTWKYEVVAKVKKAHRQFSASISKQTVEQFVARCAQSYLGKCQKPVLDKDFLRKAKPATASVLAQPSTSKMQEYFVPLY